MLTLVLYWISVRPPEFATPYIEDLCNTELARRAIGEQVIDDGVPYFKMPHLMAPMGLKSPFFSGWNIERDLFGGLVSQISPNIPWPWLFLGLSIFVSYLGIGFISKKMGVWREHAWIIALSTELLNLPRHLKLWHHYDMGIHHWIYLGIFLDAWIWLIWNRERRWSLVLESWRGFLVLGCFTGTGYHWGPNFVIWLLVRGAMALDWIRSPGGTFRFDVGRVKNLILPLGLSAGILAICLYWFIPLYRAVGVAGPPPQQAGFGGAIGYVFWPVWAEQLVHFFSERSVTLPSLVRFETVISPGWTFWIPMFLATFVLGIRKLRVIAPFAFLFLFLLVYMNEDGWVSLREALRANVPFMSFFRTISRVGLFFPAILAVCIALSWQELSQWFQEFREKKMMLYKFGISFYGVVCFSEATVLLTPVNALEPLSEEAARVFALPRERPGDTVLTFPFCTAGGNGVCTEQLCPRYPYSTVGTCTHLWHGKKVYGSYAARQMPRDCRTYEKEPYLTWMQVWKDGRCFSSADWSNLCDYLSKQSGLSSLLVFPDLWFFENRPAADKCLAELETHLGPSIPGGEVNLGFGRGHDERMALPHTRVFHFEPRCLDSP